MNYMISLEELYINRNSIIESLCQMSHLVQ